MEDLALVYQVGQTARFGFGAEFAAGVGALLCEELFQAGAQTFSPIAVDGVAQQGIALFAEFGAGLPEIGRRHGWRLQESDFTSPAVKVPCKARRAVNESGS